MPNPVAVLPLSPISFGSMLARFGSELRAVVIVKATFAIGRDRGAWVIAPRPLVERDVLVHAGAAERLVEATDYVPVLRGAGVVLTGSARAAAGRPVQEMSIRLGVSHRGQPRINKHLVIRSASPFAEMPVVYERARGGPAVRANPCGSDAPNIVDPRDPSRPAGFGPIASAWSPRDGARLELGPSGEVIVPPGFDVNALNAAPVDQQLDSPLLGDEWLVLDGFHAALPRVQSQLPQARAEARAARADRPGVFEPIDMRADTLVIDADALVASVVWRGHLTIASAEEAATLRVFAGVEVPGAALAWPGPPVSTRAGSASGASASQAPALPKASVAAALGSTTAFSLRDVLPALPFAKADEAPSSSRRSPVSSTVDAPRPTLEVAQPLPFVNTPTPFAMPPVRRPARIPSGTGDLNFAKMSVAPVPFDPRNAAAPPASALPPSTAVPIVIVDESTQASPAPAPSVEVLAAPPLAPPSTKVHDPPSSAAARAVEAPAPPPADSGAALAARATEIDAAPKTLGVDVAAPAGGAATELLATIAKRRAEQASLRDLKLAGADLSGADLGAADLREMDLSATRLAGASLRGARLSGARLVGTNLVGADLSQADATGADLTRADLRGANLEGCTLADANLSATRGEGARAPRIHGARARFTRASWDDADFTDAELDHADFSSAALNRARFVNAGLVDATFIDVVARGASWASARAGDAKFNTATLVEASFEGADAARARFDGAKLDRARFDGATLEGARLTHATAEGASFVNSVLRGASLQRFAASGCDLAGADVRGADLRQAKLARARLDGANLHGVQGMLVDLGGASLKGANLGGAALREANFSGASLEGASLDAADLREATLIDANLTATSQHGTRLGGARLKGAILPAPDASIQRK